jgi:hypothetical protein
VHRGLQIALVLDRHVDLGTLGNLPRRPGRSRCRRASARLRTDPLCDGCDPKIEVVAAVELDDLGRLGRIEPGNVAWELVGGRHSFHHLRSPHPDPSDGARRGQGGGVRKRRGCGQGAKRSGLLANCAAQASEQKK